MAPHRTRVRSALAAAVTAVLALGCTTFAASPAAHADGPPAPEDTGYYSSRTGDSVGAAVNYARMMAIPSLDTGFAPVIHPPAGDLQRACPPSRCRDSRVPLPAGVRVSDNRVRVLLPQGYAQSHRRYPVVYLFTAGASGWDGYTRRSMLTRITRSMPAIFVMPDGGVGKDLGMFSDWVDGTWQWETYHTRVLPRWVDRHFRTQPGQRAAVGNSLSVTGALAYAAAHPGLYRAVLSLSGLLDTDLLVANSVPPGLRPPGFPDLTRVWGNRVTHAANWAAHNPRDIVGRLRGVRLLISSGTGYLVGPQRPGESGSLEHLVWQTHREFLGELTSRGVPFQARISEGNRHGWPWFDRPMRWGLAEIMRTFATR